MLSDDSDVVGREIMAQFPLRDHGRKFSLISVPTPVVLLLMDSALSWVKSTQMNEAMRGTLEYGCVIDGSV